jgi:hypothetical protein
MKMNKLLDKQGKPALVEREEVAVLPVLGDGGVEETS